MTKKNFNLKGLENEAIFSNIKESIEKYGAFYQGTIEFYGYNDGYSACAFFPMPLTFRKVFHSMLKDFYENMNRQQARKLLKTIKKHKDGSQSLTVYNGDGTATKFTLQIIVNQNQEPKNNENDERN